MVFLDYFAANTAKQSKNTINPYQSEQLQPTIAISANPNYI